MVISTIAAGALTCAQQSVAPLAPASAPQAPPKNVPIVPVAQPATVPVAKLALLYDEIPDATIARRAEAVDAQRYLLIYQGCDPQAVRTGLIDVEAVIREISNKTANGAPRWGMLDFEDPFTANLQLGVDSPKYQATSASMIATMRAVRTRFPNILWTFYGTPFVPYWLDGKNWLNATPEAKSTLLEKLYKVYAPLAAEVDWVSTSIYPVYDPLLFEPKTPDLVRAHGRAWRTASVGFAKILAAGKPVIPTVSPYWQPNGVATAGTSVPEAQFIEDQVEPAAAAGADGVAIWTGVGYGITLAIDGYAKNMPQDETLGTRVWRAAFISEYLDNQPPRNWSDAVVRATLVRKSSNTILDAIRWIRLWQPKETTP